MTRITDEELQRELDERYAPGSPMQEALRSADRLVNLRTRVRGDTADRLAAVARKHERSVAAEIRVAIVRHLAATESEET